MYFWSLVGGVDSGGTIGLLNTGHRTRIGLACLGQVAGKRPVSAMGGDAALLIVAAAMVLVKIANYSTLGML